ncbi:MAG: LPXTG cell wall anchor domain-containing protein, partial [Oscillospiraceae bacterium]|nr:LPXTG cell wall anchor domain-containing protein [Oscillospiraceae bacterium]
FEAADPTHITKITQPSPNTYTVVVGANKVDPPTPTFAPGYKLATADAYKLADGTVINLNALPLPATGTTLTVKVYATLIEYTVTFVPDPDNDWVTGVTPPADLTYTVADPVVGTPTVTYKNGYEFGGYKLPNGTILQNLNNVPLPQTGTNLEIKVFAQPKIYRITFVDAKGGQLSVSGDLNVGGKPFQGASPLIVPDTATASYYPEYEEFNGWSISAGAGTVDFGGDFTNYVMPDNSVVFTIKSKPIVYTVKFSAANGAQITAIAPATATYDKDDRSVAAPTSTCAAGYELAAVAYKLANGTTVDLTALPYPATGKELEIKVYASPITYTANFVVGTNVTGVTQPAQKNYTVESSANVGTPTVSFKPGYEADGYEVNGKKVTSLTGLPAPTDGTKTLNITVLAKAIDYTVTFQNVAGVAIAALTQTGKHVGDSIGEPAAPAGYSSKTEEGIFYSALDVYLIATGQMRLGYKASWVEVSGLTTQAIGDTVGFPFLLPARNVVLKLAPVAQEYTVTFLDADSAVLSDTTKVAVDTVIPATAEPAVAHEANEVVSWTVTAGPDDLLGKIYTASGGFPAMPAQGVTLKASVATKVIVDIPVDYNDDPPYAETAPGATVILPKPKPIPGEAGVWTPDPTDPTAPTSTPIPGDPEGRHEYLIPDDANGKINLEVAYSDVPAAVPVDTDGDGTPDSTLPPIVLGDLIPTPSTTPTPPEGSTFEGWEAIIPDPSGSQPTIQVPLHVVTPPSGLESYYVPNPAGGYDLKLTNLNPDGTYGGLYALNENGEWELAIVVVPAFDGEGSDEPEPEPPTPTPGPGGWIILPIPIPIFIPIILPIPIIIPIDLDKILDWWQKDGNCCSKCGKDDCNGTCGDNGSTTATDPVDPSDVDDANDADGAEGFYPVDTGDHKGIALLAAMGLGMAAAGAVVFGRKKKEEDED